VTATAVARYIDGYSIYTARLRARPRGPDADPDGAPAADSRPAVPVPTHQRHLS
jgi:hypothetical protein